MSQSSRIQINISADAEFSKHKNLPISVNVLGDPEQLAFMLVMVCQAIPGLHKVIYAATKTMDDPHAMEALKLLAEKMKIVHTN